MSSEKSRIDFSGLTQFLSQFDEAKGHIFRSQREFLLAMRSVADILIKLSENGEEDPYNAGAANVLLVLRTVLDYLLSKIPDGQQGEGFQSKLEALQNVIRVLDSEEKRLEPFCEDEVTAAKIEAICAIRKLVQKEMEHLRTEAKKEASPRIRKVDIE